MDFVDRVGHLKYERYLNAYSFYGDYAPVKIGKDDWTLVDKKVICNNQDLKMLNLLVRDSFQYN